MKLKALGTAFLFTSVSAIAQVLVSDDFSGAAINSAKWQVILPLSTSVISLSGGSLTTTGRGIVATVSQITQPYSVSGVFTPLSSLEHFEVILRSNLFSNGASDSYERQGVTVGFVMDGQGISMGTYTSAAINSTVSTIPYHLVVGKSYSYTITDDGANINVSVDGVSALYGNTSFRTGNYVGFYSRELVGVGSKVDAFAIAALNPTATAAPSIASQPTSESVVTGSTATFSVGVTGSAPFTYQWSFNGVPITGATSSSYAVSNAQASNAGSYSVTVSNSTGSVTSSTSTLTVTTALLSKLINVSTLGSSGFTMGFVIGGNTPKTVLVRGVGPTLATFGVQNPASQTTLTLYSGQTVLSTNSAWGTAVNAAQMIGAGGSFALVSGSKDSAILTTLNPGAYTAQVTGNGAILLEVYEVQ